MLQDFRAILAQLSLRDTILLKTNDPDSLSSSTLKDAAVGERFQFERVGYFNVDDDSTSEQLVFNKTVGLRDSWGGGKK